MSDWTIVYYHNKRGEKVVSEEIKSFGLNNHAKIITIIDMLADYGFNLPSRYIKHIEGKIWEIRIDRCRYPRASSWHFKTQASPDLKLRVLWLQ